jgi:signal transduction histidine kinase
MQAHTEHVQAAASGFLPHGYCYLWNPPLLWTHVVSDVLIGGSYVVISVALAYLVHRARRDIPFSVVFVAFGLFIITCGLTHFMEVWTLWNPIYWASGGVKAVTAVASVATAAAMPVTVPQVLTTLRDAKLSRERELAHARAVALEEQNELLQAQAMELEIQTEAARELARELEDANQRLRDALVEAEAARGRAEAADQAKSDFLATMSHELRTPLNAIIGYEQLLEDEILGPVTPPQKEPLRRIGTSAQHLLGLIDQVLTFAQTEAGAERVRPEPLRVAEVVQAVLPMVEPAIRAKGLAFQVRAADEELRMETDGGKLRQILLNLLSNAAKFTEAGRVGLEVDSEGDAVRFVVRDTGIGISEENLPRVYDAFWQVEHARNRSYEGTGLGLAVTHRLVTLLGGTVAIESVLGGGTVVTVRLPRVLAAADVAREG